jgi:hypothetical protein
MLMRTSGARKTAQGWQAANPDLDRRHWRSSKTNADKADEFTCIVLPTIYRMVDTGVNRLAIARELNAIGIPTARRPGACHESSGFPWRRESSCWVALA